MTGAVWTGRTGPSNRCRTDPREVGSKWSQNQRFVACWDMLRLEEDYLSQRILLKLQVNTKEFIHTSPSEDSKWSHHDGWCGGGCEHVIKCVAQQGWHRGILIFFAPMGSSVLQLWRLWGAGLSGWNAQSDSLWLARLFGPLSKITLVRDPKQCGG